MTSVSTPEEELPSVGDSKAKMKSINDLPTEILVKIFADFMRTEGPRKFLSSVPAVFRGWRNVSTMPSLWTKVTLISLYWNFDHLLKLGEKGLLHATRSLSLSTDFEKNMTDQDKKDLLRSSLKLKPADIMNLVQYYPNLKSINISCSVMTKAAMEYLTVARPHVEELVMGRVISSIDDFDPEGHYGYFMAMSSRILDPVFSVWGQKLRHLDLNACTLSKDGDLFSKLSSCPSLEELRLSNTHCVRTSLYSFSCPIGKLHSSCPKLRVLELFNCDVVIQGDEKFVGFREMREFTEFMCDFHGLDLSLLLKNSTELE